MHKLKVNDKSIFFATHNSCPPYALVKGLIYITDKGITNYVSGWTQEKDWIFLEKAAAWVLVREKEAIEARLSLSVEDQEKINKEAKKKYNLEADKITLRLYKSFETIMNSE